MKKILILCPYPQGWAAGQRLKYEQYFDNWTQEGYEITVSSFFSNDTWKILYEKGHLTSKILGTLSGYFRRVRTLFSLREFELIYIFMWITPLGPPIFERLVRFLSRKIIYDFDDAAYLELPTAFQQPKKFFDFFRAQSKPKYLIRTSNHVIVSSSFSLEYCEKQNLFNKASYIPCSLDTKRFVLKKHSDSPLPVIGWTGTFSSVVYLDSMKDIFYKLKELRDFKLVLITNFDYELPGIDLEVIRWNKASEIKDLHRIDIGIYPLIEEEWSLGKGGLKVLQYMAIGVPAIATNYGTACNIINSEKNGFLVNNEAEWIETLCLLIDSYELREKIGKKARETVVKNYSIDRNKIIYLEILNSL